MGHVQTSGSFRLGDTKYFKMQINARSGMAWEMFESLWWEIATDNSEFIFISVSRPAGHL